MKLSAAVKEKGVGDTNRNERELQEKEKEQNLCTNLWCVWVMNSIPPSKLGADVRPFPRLVAGLGKDTEEDD